MANAITPVKERCEICRWGVRNRIWDGSRRVGNQLHRSGFDIIVVLILGIGLVALFES